MGCVLSLPFLSSLLRQTPKYSSPSKIVTTSNPIASNAPSARPRFDPKEFTFSKITGGQVHMKLPGSIPSGMPFSIEDCENSSLCIFDCTAQVTVDACISCFIFIGPCEGSIFIRECKDCVIVAAGQQFRMRDCDGVFVSLYAATQPIIETSRDIQVSCFWYFYEELASQFDRAGLSVLANEWFNIYDFNDAKGVNWTAVSVYNHADAIKTFTHPLWAGSKLDKWHVPCTLGPLPRSSEESFIILSFLSVRELLELIHKIPGSLQFAQIRKLEYNPKEAERLFLTPEIHRIAKAQGRCISVEQTAQSLPSVTAIEINGSGACDWLLRESGISQSNPLVFFRITEEAVRGDRVLFFGDGAQ
ncbi:tubulin binding cofactor C-domain-containing protein [Polychytrium aggregatum]|uniref:tubulin binding cofactor C-domain-containing protein n=1 Tax=Polychytrium aggregatum TaxID=110093 RepID=UPI0022FEE9E7|nr:tubulin binding cofactor C-domain-containing protein [Polychytrium aggregatum]KAI9205187.1 tubulin binding cofactor C-domain-containing protein [Polychytrium aggregatum]